MENERFPKNLRRSFFTWLGGLVLVMVVLTLVGVVYESTSEAADRKANPPPGKMIDIGEYRLHIKCTGSGSPTVVIESGWGDFSASWGWVQPKVAKTTRVCSYDRAGMGWSEASSKPRTAREFAKDLHILLTKSNEVGPYVLVGHSLGAYTVRVYAHDYPAEVAGVVLVDPQNLSNSKGLAFNPAPKPAGNSPISWLAWVGVIRLLAGPLGSIEDLPVADKRAYTAYAVAPRSVQTFLNEGMGMSEGAAQAREVTSLGELPVIVLSRGKDMDPESKASQARYLKLSTNSQHLVAENSGHAIMIEQPDAATAAILKMVEQVRSGKH